jgi:hypothetical protein
MVIQKRRGVLHTMGRGGVVAGKSVSHHQCHSSLQRIELQWVYNDTGMARMDCAMGADGDTGKTEMDCAMRRMYSGDPGVYRLATHLISSHIFL